MKKLIKITVAVLAAGAAATLAGCSGCAGCSGNAKATTLTSSNWFTGTSYKGIQPSFVIDENHPEFTKEIIEYDLTFSKGANTTYSVEYDKGGSYVTEFYAVNYDWNNNPVYSADKEEIVYCYETRMSVSGVYTLLSNGETEKFSDSVTSVCYFRAAGKNLSPIYSKQIISSTSPAIYQAKNLNDALRKVNVTYENYYSWDCTEVKTITTENGNTEEEVRSLKKVNNSLFDNCSLYIAVRSMKLSDSLSQTVSVYNPADGGIAARTISGTDTAFGDGLKDVSDVLEANDLYKREKAEDNISTVAVNVNYSGGNLYGTAQTIWYAAITDPDNNTARATMLKLSVPLSYSLGTMNYTLKTITSTLWNE